MSSSLTDVFGYSKDSQTNTIALLRRVSLSTIPILIRFDVEFPNRRRNGMEGTRIAIVELCRIEMIRRFNGV